MHATALIVWGKMTWDGQCDFYAGVCWITKLILSIRLQISGLGSHVPILGVCLNTSKSAKHTWVLWHAKGFANLKWYLLLTWGSKLDYGRFLGERWLSRERLGRQEKFIKGNLGQCLANICLEKKKKETCSSLGFLQGVKIPCPLCDKENPIRTGKVVGIILHV